MARYNGRLHCIVGVLPTCYKRKAATYFYPPGGTGPGGGESIQIKVLGATKHLDGLLSTLHRNIEDRYDFIETPLHLAPFEHKLINLIPKESETNQLSPEL